MKNGRRVVAFFAIMVIVFVLYYFWVSKHLNFENIKQNRLLLQHYIDKNYWASVATFLAIYIVLTAMAFPFAVFLTVVGGFLFGTFWGAVYGNIGATIGSSIAFLAIRYLIGGWLHKRFDHRLKKFRKELKKYGYSYLLSIHFTSVVPLFIVNIVAALANVSFWTFFWTTLVGTFPGFLVYSFAGQQFMQINSVRDIFSWEIALAFVGLGILSLIPVLLRRRKKNGAGIDYV